MHTFRSMLSGNRKTKAKTDRNSQGSARTCIEGLEQRVLLSAAINQALDASANLNSVPVHMVTTSAAPHVMTPARTVTAAAAQHVMKRALGVTPFVLTGTTTTLSLSPGSSTYGTNVTLTATVSPAAATATGTVSFFNGLNLLGTPPAPSTIPGIVTLVVNNLPAGMDTISANYNGDAVTYAASSAMTQTADIAMANTTVAVVPAPTMSSYETPVTLSATITDTATGSPVDNTAGGSVTFFDNGVSIGSTSTISNGIATFMTSSPLPVGADQIKASYSGDMMNFNASPLSPAATETVSKANTTTTVTPLAPTTVGTTVTITATVSDPLTTGTVTYSDNGVSIGTAPIVANGVSTFMTSMLPVGANPITAFYGGDGNFNPSPTSAAAPEFVNLITTTTTLALSSNSTVFTNPVTLTATVNPAISTGTVTFFNGASALGSGPVAVSGGVATLVVTDLPVGADSITANFTDGMVTYTDSASTASPATTDTVTTDPTTTVLTTSAPASVSLGTLITLTATITPSTATGTVNFIDGFTTLPNSPVVVSGGVATLVVDTTTLAISAHTFTATFTGTPGYGTSLSSLGETITPAVATVSVSPSANPANLFSTVTFTATVAPSGSGLPNPTGTVSFFDNGVMLGMLPSMLDPITEMATLVVPSTVAILGLGNHPITAVYSGDSNYGVSNPSAPVNEMINPAVAVITLSALPTSSAFGGNVVLTAMIAPMVPGSMPLPSQTLQFFDNGVPISAPQVVGGGTVPFPTTMLPVGNDSITVEYSGDMFYQMIMMSSPPLIVPVGLAPTTTTLTASPTSVMLGAKVTLTAAINPSTATGSVTFFAGGAAIMGSPATVIGGVATLVTTALPLGSDTITATYSGDSNDGSSMQTAPIIVTVGQSTTITSLSVAPATAALGAPVNLTATVTPTTVINPTATGTVTFIESGTINLGTAPLINGTAILSTTMLALGTDTITATYNGSTNYTGSSSPSKTEIITAVTATTSTTTLATSANPIAPGDSVTFTATVVAASSGGPTPIGDVTFFDGAVPIGIGVTLNNGVAVFSTTTLPSGTNNITVTYNGGNYSSSTSATLVEIVGTATSFVTALTVSNNSVIVATPVTLLGTVSPATFGGALPTGGSITFLDGTTSLGTIPLLSNGTAEITITLPAGPHPITASYTVGTSNSASTPIVVTINSAAVPSIDGLVLPPDVVAGLTFPAKVPVVLANAGAKIKGTFTINIFASTTTILDGTQVLLATLTKKNYRLNANQSRTLNVRLRSVPADMAAGTYNILVQVIDPNGASNLGKSTFTIGVLAPFVQLDMATTAVTPSVISLGAKGIIDVTVTNNGNEPVTGMLSLTLQPSTDGVTPISDVTLAVLNIRRAKFNPGQTRRYRLHFSTGALAAGTYFPYFTATLGDNSGTSVGAIQFTIG